MTVAEQDALLHAVRALEANEVAGDELLEALLEPDGRASLIGLLNRTDLANTVRLRILGLLEEHVEAADALPLARAVARKHSDVVLAAVPVLLATGSAAALFAFRRGFARPETDIRDALAKAALALSPHVMAERYIRRSAVPPVGFDARELALAAASADPATLAALRTSAADARMLATLEAGVAALLEDLSRRTREGSLSDVETRLREALHNVVLLSGLGDQVLQDRSLDSLFRRRDLDDVAVLRAHLPEAVVARYAERALSRANRRSQRVDRAVLALDFARSSAAVTRERLRASVVECLDEDDDDLAAGAIRVLAEDGDTLPGALRKRVIARFGELPATTQERLAPGLARLGQTAEEDLDAESFLRWVDGASEADRERRLRLLKQRWDSTVVSPEHAASFVTTLGRGIHRLPAEDQEAWREELVEGALSWLYRQKGRSADAVRALLRWPGFGRLVLADLELADSLLRAEQARTLLAEIIGAAQPADAGIRDVAEAPAPTDFVRRVIVPVLVDAIRADARTGDAVFRAVAPVARRRLLWAAIVAASAAKREIERVGQTSVDAAEAAAARHGGAVLAALDDALAANEGNDELRAQFEAVRRAVASVVRSEDVSEPPPGVVDWRRRTAERLPGVVLEDDGLSPLGFAEKGACPAEAVVRLLLELDQRVHSPRVVPAVDRGHLRHDLLRCIDRVIADDLLARDDVGRAVGGRAALGQLLWGRWASRQADPVIAVLSILETPTEPMMRQQLLLRVDALVARLDADQAGEIADSLAEERLPDAWGVISVALVNRLREVETLKQEAKSRGVEVMERVAERIDPPLRAIEGLMVGYFRLRNLLAAAGWKPIAEPLGRELRFDQLNPSEHVIEGEGASDRYLVRSLGIRVHGKPVRPAVVEPLHDTEKSS